MDALVSTMPDVGLTKGNAKYKKEISNREKADWRRKSGSARPEAEARSARLA